jgi:transcriptional regulator with XRE-family HTH domain
MQVMTGSAAEIFRSNVRIMMRSRGLTITKLAEDAEMSRPGLSRILAAKDGVTLERADSIAEALGIPLRELLSENLENVLTVA